LEEKKIKVMTNNVETEILIEEPLKYVLEYTCVGQLMLSRDSSGKEIRELELLGKIYASGVYTG
jgi:hypothetical protein